MVEQKNGLTNNAKIELVEDNITLNEEFKKNVAIPYFKDIYKDLVNQSDNKSKGINKVAILNVSLLPDESSSTLASQASLAKDSRVS